MSLAPAERRALDKIEDGLRRSDRRLARMMTRFKVPLSRGGLMILVRRLRRSRRSRRSRRLIGWAVVATAVALVVAGILNSPATPRTCATPGGPGSAAAAAAAATQAGHCPLALHRGHAASTAVSVPAKLPVVRLVRSGASVHHARVDGQVEGLAIQVQS